jgi:hypothetical protein
MVFLDFHSAAGQPFTMHDALAVLISIFFFTSSIAALHIPQSPLSAGSNPSHRDRTGKCTFTLWHKQLCASAKKTNYIQMNEIEDHANNISIDVASLRPAASHNSYVMISADEMFAVEGLLDDRSLVIGVSDQHEDELWFTNDDVFFSSSEENGEEAWCVAGEWDNEDWECGKGSRVSRIVDLDGGWC